MRRYGAAPAFQALTLPLPIPAYGKTDILWRNTGTGDNVVWHMDGINLTRWIALFTDQNWKIVGR